MSNEENVINDEAMKPEENSAEPVADQEPEAQAETPAESDAAEAAEAEKSEADTADGSAVQEKSDEEPAPQKIEKPEKPKKDKPAKQTTKPRRAASGMSRTFKLVYYPVLALVALIVMIFSIVDGVCGYSPEAYGAGYVKSVRAHIKELSSDVRSSMTSAGIDSARDYIVQELTRGSRFILAEEVKEGEEDDDELVTTVTEWASNSNANSAVPTVTIMTSQPSVTLQNAAGTDGYYVGKEITNVIAAIPSTQTRKAHADKDFTKQSGAVIVTVRYDTRPDTYGAADNASFVAVAIETLRDLVEKNAKLENDLVVVFTEELGAAYGVYTFFESFKGLDEVASRAVVGISLDAYGNSGTLALTDASGAGLDYINAYTKISGSIFNSSVVNTSIPDNIKSNAVKGFGDVPAIQVAVLGGLDAYGSLDDTAKNIPDSIINQQSAFLKNYVEAFAKASKDVSAEDGNESVFFSYFDWGTVAYNSIASYVIGALILILLGVNVALLIVKKTFSIKKLLIACGVELLVIAGTLVAMFAAYFLVTLMLTGFGVLPIHAITQIRYFNGGIFFAAMLISLASSFGLTSLFKKLFKVTSSDTVRGTAFVFGVVGMIMSFAAPASSYLVSWLGLLLSAVLLVTICLNGKLKDRFGFGFDRLFIYVVPVILCMPFMLSGMSMLTELLPLYMLPVTMMLFTGMLGVAVPYLDRSAVVFDKLAKKLPKRTQRVERTVTERVEDRAKKGKFTEREVRRVEKEKVAVNYKNYFGVSVIAVIGVVVALFSGGFGATFGQTITDVQSYNDAIYNDSIVYVWDGSSHKLVVKDLMAYKYIRYAVNDLEWDAANNYYYKNVNYGDRIILSAEPDIVHGDDKYTVQSAYGSLSSVILTIPSARQITSITVAPNTSDAETDGMKYEFYNEDEIVLRLPCGYADGNFTLTIEGSSPSTIEYEEHYSFVYDETGENPLGEIDEWNAIVREYNGQDVLHGLRGGIVLKRSL
ncbi:MAG: M28 family peptidase [Clostridiales bacterium]|nr:M28 family peptidase [Clostridiales bacterium]